MNPKWKRQRRGAGAVAAASRRRLRRRFNISRGRTKNIARKMSKVHYFKEKFSVTGIDPSNTAGEITRNYTFALASLPNIAEYQALFDMYKLNGVKLEFRCKRQPGAISNVTLPVMYSVIDYDGEADAQISVSNLLQRQNCRITYFNDNTMYAKIYLKPKQLQQAINLNTAVNPPTASVVGRYMTSGKWNDLQQGASLSHYGVLVDVPGAGLTTASCPIDVWVTYYFACKSQI